MNFVFITNVKRLKMKLNSDFVLRTPIKTQENLELTLYSQRADRKADLFKTGSQPWYLIPNNTLIL